MPPMMLTIKTQKIRLTSGPKGNSTITAAAIKVADPYKAASAMIRMGSAENM